MLFLLSSGLLVVSVGGIMRSLELILYAGALQLPDSDEALGKTVAVELAKATATLNYDPIIVAALAEEDIHRADIYMSVARRLGVALQPETIRRYEEATSTWATALRTARNAGQGFVSGQVNDVDSFAGSVAADLTGFGDLRDLQTQGIAYLNGQPYDELVLGLSIVGLAATVLDPGQVLNTGAALLKGASRFRRASASFLGELTRLARETVDLPATRQILEHPTSLTKTAAAATQVIRPTGLTALKRLAADAGTLAGAGGTRGLIMALRHADNAEELSLFARVSRTAGKQTDEVIEIAGKPLKTALRAHKLTLRTVGLLTGWVTALSTGLLGLISSLSKRLARLLGTQRLLAWLAAALERRQLHAV